VPTGPSPHGLVVTPDRGPRAALRLQRMGQRVLLLATGSTDPDGIVERYAWRFGDGHAHPNGSAIEAHRYRHAGRYTVTVTVTDDEGCSKRQTYTGQTTSCNGGPQAVASKQVRIR
jgi:PKD domain